MGVNGDNIDVCCCCEMVDRGIDGVVGAVVCALDFKVEPAISPSFFSDVFAVTLVELLKSRFGDDEENNFLDIRNDLLFPFELSTLFLPVVLLFLSEVMDLLLPPPTEAAELLLEDLHKRLLDFDGVPKGVRGENGGSLSNDSIDLEEYRESRDSSSF